ncbi:MAG: DUF177 domain-containing protein [Nitrospira sp.]|nr:DUF177 domain-containing protein [Nitrospira sp.]
MVLLSPKIADITAEGCAITGDVTGEELGVSDEDMKLRGVLAVGLDLVAVERTICVTGVVEGTAVRQCVRCLKEFDDPVAFAVRVAYEREGKAPQTAVRQDVRGKKKSVEEIEVTPEERNDDLYYYVGDHLELAPMVREQLILASPMHPLCTGDCRGLCMTCGKDLNEGPCQCAVESTGNPFHVLRAMKEKVQQAPADR